MEWSVYVEARPDNPGDAADPEAIYEGIEELMDLLSENAAVPAGDGESYSVQMTVPCDSAAEAGAEGQHLFTSYAEKVGLPVWPVVRCEVVRCDVFDAELERPQIPDLVGSQEAVAMLGITRQRLHELRSTGRFPVPLLEVAATPLWARSGIEAFLDRWDRRPGRRRSAATA